MDESKLGFQAELRISPRVVLACMALASLLVSFIAEGLTDRWSVLNAAMSLSLSLLAAAAIGWLVYAWRPLVGRWVTLLSVAGVVFLTDVFLGLPEALALLAVPVALAMPLIGYGASVGVAVGEAALLIWLARTQPGLVTPASLGVSYVGIGCALAIAFASFRPTLRLVSWLAEYFERVQHFVGEARDHRVQLEQALESFANANRQLALANERTAALRSVAEEAQKAKTAFVANVSHEFRTPLNMIIGLVDLMVNSPEIYAMVLSPEMRQDLGVIHRNCEHLSRMINDVLDLTRMEAGRLSLHRERVALPEIIETSVETVRPLLEKKGLTFTQSIPDDLPEIYCDRTRVQQVILNLISNATRFTDAGGISTIVEQQDQVVTVRVQDTGSGIAPESLTRIFEPFEQGQLWHGKGGTGLGLSISKRFVELHGGRMWVDSDVGSGTTFSFTLPISPPMGHVITSGNRSQPDWVWREQAFRNSALSYSDELLKPRIVLYDEGGDVAMWLEHYTQDFECVRVESVAQIAPTLAACPAHAVLCNIPDPDALMPTIKVVQAQSNGTPIIGCCIPPAVERATAAGALGHLIKPVTREKLIAAVAAVPGPVKRVLLVDDDPDVLQLFRRVLEIHDPQLEIMTADSGNEALMQVRRATPDLMLLDLVMPGLDGWHVLERMRLDAEVPQVPTFLVSAQDLADRPLNSDFLVASVKGGIPLTMVIRSSQELSALMLRPERTPDLAPE